MAAAWLFASSYTFWSQAVIAEVYALHIACVALTLLLALWWDRRPTTPRLAALFVVYAAGFGNHLSMILLFPALAIFLATRSGWRSVGTWRTASMAIACAALGASQYLWNFHALWLEPAPPHGWIDGLYTFWFDVTKSDWRDTMVASLPASMAIERLRMYAFDVYQQFGWLGPSLALAGAVQLVRTDIRRAVLVIITYVVTLAFALSYSVGDTHVFLLPSHLMMALLAAPGIIWVADLASGAGQSSGPAMTRIARVALAIFVGVAASIRTYHDYPALDRSRDTRPSQWLETLATGLDDRHAVLLTNLNWQAENGLNYFASHTRTSLAFARMPSVLLYAPALIRDNRSIGRQVVLTAGAAALLDKAYGPLFDTTPDPAGPDTTMADSVRGLPPGTRYALCVLQPTRDMTLNEPDLRATVETLTGHQLTALPSGDYAAIVGTVGSRPILVRSSNRPFRTDVVVEGLPITVRMESWLAFDTIRRMGFGHVISGHRHSLIVERGVSLVVLDRAGAPLRTAYAAGLFAPEARYIVSKSPD
jgi:hypothetical protein